MNVRPIFISLPIFFFVFLLQESVINQFRLPGGGFSIFLIFALIWAIHSTPEVAAFAGFLAGLMMDFSPSSSTPIGHWTLLMIAACYSLSYLGSGNDDLSKSPLGFTFLVTVAVLLVESAYALTGVLFGLQSGELGQVSIAILGISMWSLVVTPIVLPIFSRLHALTFNAASVI